MPTPPNPQSLQTLAVTAGRPPRVPDGPLNPPLVPASTYHAGGDVGYGRYGNPTWEALEEAVGALEGGPAVAFASGMAAVTATLALVPEGRHVLAPHVPYLGTRTLVLRAGGRLVDVTDVAGVRAALHEHPGTAMLWLETPTNPLLDVADVGALADAAHEVGALCVVDSTAATPVLQRPLEQGADVVVHAATKFLAGHADVLLGVGVARDAGVVERLVAHRSEHGATPGSLECWLALRGIRTLPLRMREGAASAAELARRLATHPAVSRVRYPGVGALLSVEVAGDADAAQRVCTGTALWVHATSFGGVESTLERRRRWPTESELVPETLLRLSVGVEDVEDLWADLDAALQAATRPRPSPSGP